MNQPLMTDLNMLVRDIYMQVRDKLDQGNYTIYGHSMGALAGCLLARKIVEHGHTPPLHVFVSGTTGPSAQSRDEKKRHLLGKKEFIEEIRALNGSPEEILQNEELINYFEPILRADFTATENYTYEDGEPLDIPFTVITGNDEAMTMEDIYLWQKETTYKIDFIQFPGNHFFIFKYAREILSIIAKKLLAYPKTYKL